LGDVWLALLDCGHDELLIEKSGHRIRNLDEGKRNSWHYVTLLVEAMAHTIVDKKKNEDLTGEEPPMLSKTDDRQSRSR
jgi:hypothetical protein